MSTVNDLVNSSLRLLGVLASGETAGANEATDALKSLNVMLDSWSTEQLATYGVMEEVFPLTLNQQTYTIGTGGNLNTVRPQRIQNAMIRVVNGSTTADLNIDLINQDEWSAIISKTVQSAIPLKLFYIDTYPLGKINLWPIPNNASNSLVIWSWKPLSSFATLATTLSLPPGYEKALKYGLALELAAEYGKMPSDIVVAEANNSKANIKRMNIDPVLMTSDAVALGSVGGKSFNWITGE